MSAENIIMLLGGLGAFLFGMSYMGDGLELAAGAKMKDLLEKLTRNPVLGFIVGMLVTVVIQSSSATTIMTMGFINAGIMDLVQATGVIAGANIGTTITSVLIALDVSAIAPICIAVGAVLMLFVKKKTWKYTGQVLLGFGLLFQGLHTMSSSMEPLQHSVKFQDFIAGANNPLVAFLIGIVMCAILQSSSAAVGIVQALAMKGLMPLEFSAFLVCGINIGSASPCLLSAINARHNAKRAAIVYLLFNVVGAVIFVPMTLLTPLVSLIETHIASGSFQVAVYHILFKAVTGLILLPLTNWIVKVTYKFVPIQEHESQFRLRFIDKNMIGSPAVLTVQIQKEVMRMADLVESNLKDAMDGLINHEITKNGKISENEEVIDYLTSEISNYLSKVNVQELPEQVSEFMTCAYRTINELEQIGDHAFHISKQAEKNVDLRLTYSDSATQELRDLSENVQEVVKLAMNFFVEGEPTMDEVARAAHLSRRMVELTGHAQSDHLHRLRNNECAPEQGMTFLETVNSISRIVNHSTAIERSVMSRNVKQEMAAKNAV